MSNTENISNTTGLNPESTSGTTAEDRLSDDVKADVLELRRLLEIVAPGAVVVVTSVEKTK